MPDLTTSEKLLADFRDKLRDTAHQELQADGIAYGRFTEAQNHFMRILKTSKFDILLPLWPGQTEYPIDETIMEIVDIGFITVASYPDKDKNFNPFISLPNTSWGGDRIISITPSPANLAGFTTWNTGAYCGRTAIMDGDIMVVKAFVKPLRSKVINSRSNPVIEQDFYPNIVDWALSYHQAYQKVGKTQVKVYPDIKTLEEVKRDVKQLRDRMYGLNSVQSYDFNFIRF